MKNHNALTHQNDILDFSEAADMLGLSHPSLYRWLGEGRVKGYKAGRQWRFYRKDLQGLIKEEPEEEDVLNKSRELFISRLDGYSHINFEYEKDYKKESLLSLIIMDAFCLGAAFIHLEPQKEKRLKVSYRIEDKLSEITDLSPFTVPLLENEIYRAFKLQDNLRRGRIVLDKPYLEVKISSVSTLQGEKYTMRLLGRSHSSESLEGSFMTEEDCFVIRKMLKNPSGLILITGDRRIKSIGVLYSMVNELIKYGLKSVVIEESPEYFLEGVYQIKVDPGKEGGYKEVFSLIRDADFDAVVFDKVTKIELMELCPEISRNSLVIAGVMTGDFSESMIEGREDRLFINSLIGIISQKFIGKVCPYCAKNYAPPDNIIEKLSIDTGQCYSFLNPGGCEKCFYTGYRGDIAIYEILVFDKELKEMMMENRRQKEIREKAIEKGMRPFREKCMMWALRKMTAFDEFIRVAEESFLSPGRL